jgi:rod shape determining protein RodA
VFDLNALRQLDWLLVAAMVLVIAVGIVVISSAASTETAKKQAVFAVAGLFVFAFLACFDYHWFRKASVWVYAAALVLLVAVLIVGTGPRGAKRWFPLPLGFRFQPSEFAKLACVFIVGYGLDRFRAYNESIPYTLAPLVLVLVPMALIVKQPDLGTALVILPVTFGMLYVAGARKRYLLIVVLVGVLSLPALWFKMEPYQKKRVLEFLTVPQRRIVVRFMTAGDRESLRQRLIKELDPRGDRGLSNASLSELTERLGGGYNSEQSTIAVASGGLYGLGYKKGTQVHFDYLYAAETDFIFPALGEEWGFSGCLVVLALYFLMLERGLRIASQAVDTFGRLLACGIVLLLASHILINVAMAIGLLPITGLPLPLLSYGGSSLLMTTGSVGILQSIHTRRHYFKGGKYALDTKER